MNRNFLTSLALSFATVWLINQYFFKTTKTSEPGSVEISGVVQGDASQQNLELLRPLYRNVPLIKERASFQLENNQFVQVKTPLVHAALSNHGGAIVGLQFLEHKNNQGEPLSSLHSFSHGLGGGLALLIDDQAPEVYQFIGQEKRNNQTTVRFKAAHGSFEIYKTYVFFDDSYKINLNLEFKSDKASPEIIRPRLLLKAPFVKGLGVVKNEKDKNLELEGDDIASLVYWNEDKKDLKKSDFSGKETVAWYWNKEHLFGAEDRYFVHALVADTNNFTLRGFVGDSAQKIPTLYIEGHPIQKDASFDLSFYFGPKLYDHLHAVDNRLEDVLSFGWLSRLCMMLLKLLDYIYEMVGNYGLAIIIMTILIKLPFVPLSMYGRKKMEQFQRFQPAINRIRSKYKHDMVALQNELMRFYKEHNLSPTSQLMGCLPLVIQMPILFSLYRVLNNYLDLYNAPFALWITDLSSKDPYYVLPILMGISMIWQQSSSPGVDGKQKTMMIFMSIFMTALFANFPAGLVLYWFVNNLLSLAEDYLRRVIWR